MPKISHVGIFVSAGMAFFVRFRFLPQKQTAGAPISLILVRRFARWLWQILYAAAIERITIRAVFGGQSTLNHHIGSGLA